MRKFSLKSVCLLAGLLAVGQTFAHGIWVEQRRGNLEVVYGHGASDDVYPASRFHGAWGYDKSGNPVRIQTQSLDTHVRLVPQGSAAVIASAMNSGYSARTADNQTVAQRKSAVPGAISGTHKWKYNLTVLQSDANIPGKFDSIKLVIMPEADPTKLKAGDTLPVRVLLDGQPLAGVKLAADYKGGPQGYSVETDQDGRAPIIVRNRGLNVISTYYLQKISNDPDVDVISMNTTLTFISAGGS